MYSPRLRPHLGFVTFTGRGAAFFNALPWIALVGIGLLALKLGSYAITGRSRGKAVLKPAWKRNR